MDRLAAAGGGTLLVLLAGLLLDEAFQDPNTSSAHKDALRRESETLQLGLVRGRVRKALSLIEDLGQRSLPAAE